MKPLKDIPRLRVAVLISGTGTNLGALVNSAQTGQQQLEIVLVISNRADAPGLEHARRAGIPYRIVDKESSGNGQQQDLEIVDCLEASKAGLVILAGYMRIVGESLTRPFEGRMINLHPSLLPLYPGLNTYRKVLNAGDGEHGSSVHFVTPELDGGPVISQVHIPVLAGDDESSLAKRLAPNEHRLLLATVELFINRRVRMHSGGVLLDEKPLQRPLILNAENEFD